MLNNITPFNKFSDVPIGIRFNFDMGVHSPPLETYTPLNHNSALSFPDHVISHIHNELSLGRYSGPFSRSRLQLLIGPFWSSHLAQSKNQSVPWNVGSYKICLFPGTTRLFHLLTARSISTISDVIGVHLTLSGVSS